VSNSTALAEIKLLTDLTRNEEPELVIELTETINELKDQLDDNDVVPHDYYSTVNFELGVEDCDPAKARQSIQSLVNQMEGVEEESCDEGNEIRGELMQSQMSMQQLCSYNQSACYEVQLKQQTLNRSLQSTATSAKERWDKLNKKADEKLKRFKSECKEKKEQIDLLVKLLDYEPYTCIPQTSPTQSPWSQMAGGMVSQLPNMLGGGMFGGQSRSNPVFSYGGYPQGNSNQFA